MVSLRKLGLTAAIAASVALSTGASAATVLSPIDLVGGSSAFSATHSTSGSFTDVFDFVLTQAGTASSSITSIALGKFADVKFTSITLNGVDFTALSTGKFEAWSLDNLQLAAGSHTLVVKGSSNGTAANSASYSGTLNILASAVPEPASWALLVGGFALVGGAMRRKKPVRVLA